jgi:Uma2 family endonuclease
LVDRIAIVPFTHICGYHFVMSSVSNITTAEQLFAAGDIGRCELVGGELLMMSPAGSRHGRIAMTIGSAMERHVTENDLGIVFAAETGFIIERSPDTVLAPDAAFVKRDRVHLMPEEGYFPGPPDLAVEVLSPGEVLAKVRRWLDAGCEAVWIVDPKERTIMAHRKDQPVRTWSEGETLTGEGLVQGFALKVAKVFG